MGDRLQEALEMYVQPPCGMKRLYPGHHCSNYGDCPRLREATSSEILAAARAVANAPTVWWCEAHDSWELQEFADELRCGEWWIGEMNPEDPLLDPYECRMVEGVWVAKENQ